MSFWDKAKETLGKGAEVVTGAAGDLMGGIGSAFSAMGEATFGRLFTVVDIPAFLLPTGPNPDDYVLEFDFDATMEQLRSGVLVRPRLVIYAGRDDIDTELLAHRLNTSFTAAFQEAKTASREAVAGPAQAEHAVIEAEREATTERGAEALSTVIVGAIGVFLATNPVTNIIFLLMAVLGGKQAIRVAFKYISSLAQSVTGQSKTGMKLREIEKEFGEKEGAFEEAVSNLTIHLHPRLVELVNNILEVCGNTQRFEATEEITFPDAQPHLNGPSFRAQIDAAYHPLLA